MKNQKELQEEIMFDLSLSVQMGCLMILINESNRLVFILLTITLIVLWIKTIMLIYQLGKKHG